MRHRKVSLNRVGCCAMTHAFLRHPEHVRQWGRIVDHLELLYEIFTNTLGLEFIPNEQSALVYRSFAKHELRRLATADDARLLCRHGVAAHVQRLQRVLEQLPEDTAN